MVILSGSVRFVFSHFSTNCSFFAHSSRMYLRYFHRLIYAQFNLPGFPRALQNNFSGAVEKIRSKFETKKP